MPREASEDVAFAEAVETHRLWWETRITRQKEIDASIAAKADYEYLYDKPYEDKKKSAGSGTVHRRESVAAPGAGCGRKRRTPWAALRSRVLTLARSKTSRA